MQKGLRQKFLTLTGPINRLVSKGTVELRPLGVETRTESGYKEGEEKVDLCKGSWNRQRKMRITTNFSEITSLESQQKC